MPQGSKGCKYYSIYSGRIFAYVLTLQISRSPFDAMSLGIYHFGRDAGVDYFCRLGCRIMPPQDDGEEFDDVCSVVGAGKNSYSNAKEKIKGPHM